MRAPRRIDLVPLLMGVLVWIGTSSVAHACAVCGGNTPERTKVAFIVTTALLTFLPLGMLGGLFYWIRRRVRELEEAPLATERSPGDR